LYETHWEIKFLCNKNVVFPTGYINSYFLISTIVEEEQDDDNKSALLELFRSMFWY